MLAVQVQLSKYEVVPFQAWHMCGFSVREKIGMGFKQSDWEIVESLETSRTMLKDGRPTVCAGLIPRWHGNADAWLWIDEGAENRDIARAGREVTKFLDHMQSFGQYRRVQTTVNVEYESWNNWCKSLGFEYEGVAAKYDPLGNDHCMYARIR